MSLPSYIINWDELLAILGDKLEINIDDIDLGDLEDYLKEQFEIIIDLLKQILDLLKDKGAQRIHSISNHIPAVVAPFKFTTVFEEDVLLTGVTYSQSGWKYQDSWDLEVDGTVLFEEVGTKEIGESKAMNVFYYVPAGKPIDIIFHNDSGNSRLVWFDVEYIDLSMNTIEPDPEPEPPIPPIDNPYDWLVVMRWEDNSSADLDLHCYFACDPEKHIYYGKKELVIDEENKAWLNYDYTSHGVNGRHGEPEIVSILGMEEYTPNIYITNYNSGSITEDVTIEIYRQEGNQDVNAATVIINASQISGEKTIYVGNIKDGEFLPIKENVPYGSSNLNIGSCRI